MLKNKKALIIGSCLGLAIIGGIFYYFNKDDVQVKTAISTKTLYREYNRRKGTDHIFELDDDEEFEFKFPLSREEKKIVKEAKKRLAINNAITFYLAKPDDKERFDDKLITNLRRAENTNNKEEMSTELQEAKERIDNMVIKVELEHRGIPKKKVDDFLKVVDTGKVKSCENYLFNLEAFYEKTLNYSRIADYLRVLETEIDMDTMSEIIKNGREMLTEMDASETLKIEGIKKELECIGKQTKYLTPRQKRLYKQLCKAIGM